MKKTTIALAILALGAAGTANAGSFLNGGFEDGNFNNWTQGSGFTSNPNADALGTTLLLDPASYVTNTNWQGTITSAGFDPISGLSTVKYGAHSARINNVRNDYSVNVISQSVTNYSGTSINFAWAAVLEASHGLTDSDIFGLKVTDTTTNTVLYNAVYSSANTPTCTGTELPGVLCFSSTYYRYNDWQEVSLTVTQGHDFAVSLLASDCPYGGHAGYVYLDGFGTTQGGPGDNGTVPEPGSLALAGLGLMAAFGLRRRRSV